MRTDNYFVRADHMLCTAGCLVPLIIAVFIPATATAQEPATPDEIAPAPGVRIQDLSAEPSEAAPEPTAPSAPTGPPGEEKSVALALILSLFLPGGGLYYTEKYALGVTFTIGELGFCATWITIAVKEAKDEYSLSKRKTMGPIAAGAFMAFLAMKITEIVVSPIAAHRHNRRVRQGMQLTSMFAAPTDRGGLLVGVTYTI